MAENSKSKGAYFSKKCLCQLEGPNLIQAMLDDFGRETLQKIIERKFASSAEKSENTGKDPRKIKTPFKGVKVMAGTYGVKNIGDFLVLGKVVTVAFIKEAKKDGFQVTDLLAVLKSPELEGAVSEALQDMNLVVEEAKELDVFDGLALGRLAYGMVTDVLAEVRK